MALTSGTISAYDITDNLRTLQNLRQQLILNSTHQREEADHSLTSHIYLSNQIGNLGGEIRSLSGIVYDEFIHMRTRVNRLDAIEDGIPQFETERVPSVEIRVGSFWILNNGLLISDSKRNRNFINPLFERAIGRSVKPVHINIQTLSNDYPNNWVGGIIDREGNWQNGTLYGDDLKNDDCVGEEFTTCNKNQVGGYTEFFNGITKFKATREGSVIIYLSWENTRDPFLQFIQNELSQYFVLPNFT